MEDQQDPTKLQTGKAKRKSKSPRRSVSFLGDEKRDLSKASRKEQMLAELEKLRLRDEYAEKERKRHYEREIKKLKDKFYKQRVDEGVHIHQNVEETKVSIQKKLRNEEYDKLQAELVAIELETERMSEEVDIKYGVSLQKDGPDMVKLAEEFLIPSKASNNFGLPDRIIKELTSQEIRDLKQVFDMFDFRGRGFIKASDVQQLAAMLGFRAKKEVFRGMIDDLSKDHKGRVTFINFLDFMIKSQQGPDPFDEIQQGFKMLDKDDKGYVTFEDLQSMSDEVHCNLSNRMIREMLDEADTSGDGTINLEEFTEILLKTNAFRTV